MTWINEPTPVKVPVAWALFDVEGVMRAITIKVADQDSANWTPLFAHPPQPRDTVAEVRLADRLRHEITVKPDLTFADAIEWVEYLSRMETSQ